MLLSNALSFKKQSVRNRWFASVFECSKRWWCNIINTTKVNSVCLHCCTYMVVTKRLYHSIITVRQREKEQGRESLRDRQNEEGTRENRLNLKAWVTLFRCFTSLPNLMDHMLSKTPQTISEGVFYNQSSVMSLNFGQAWFLFSGKIESKGEVINDWEHHPR